MEIHPFDLIDKAEKVVQSVENVRQLPAAGNYLIQAAKYAAKHYDLTSYCMVAGELHKLANSLEARLC